MTRSGRQLKKPEVLKRLGALKRGGMNRTDIARTIREEFDIECSANDVKNALERYIEEWAFAAEGDEEMKNQIREEVIKTKETLKSINDRVLSLLEEMDKIYTKVKRDKPDNYELQLNSLTKQEKIVNQVLKQLKYQSELLGHLKPEKETTKNINYVNVSYKVVNAIKAMEKEGFIKIKKSLDLFEQ